MTQRNSTTTLASGRSYRYSRLLSELRTEQRLSDLPTRCAALLGGFDNDENDARLIFDALPYATVMDLALRYRAVREAVASLPADFAGWTK